MTEIELKNKFSNWAMKIQSLFIESPLLQPIGLELSCSRLILETKSDYSLDNIESCDILEELYPVAFYRPDTDAIHVFIEHKCFEKRTADCEQYAFFMFILFHEASHRLLFHTRRGKDKDSMLWNIAADMEIHNTFYVFTEIMKSNSEYHSTNIWINTKNYIMPFLFEKNDPDKCEGLFEMDYLQNVAEEIYNDLEKSKIEDHKTVSFKMTGENDQSYNVNVTTCTYTTKSGKKFSTSNIEFPEDMKSNDSNTQDKENSAEARKAILENTIMKQFEENIKGKGDEDSKISTFLKKLFNVKIDWKKILKSSLATALDKSEYFSWAKPRTSLFGLSESIYLPSQCEDENAYGTVIIARDESGSISNLDCQKAASIILEAKDYYKKIILIKHDVSITSIKEFIDMDEDFRKSALTRESNGGTSHFDVFSWIKDYAKKDDERISCCIFITDLDSDIEESQNVISDDIPRIYLCPNECLNYNHSSIKGKIIGIE